MIPYTLTNVKLLTQRSAQNFTKMTIIPNGHIDANIDKAISASTGTGISQDRGACCPVASSVETTNKQLGCLPSPYFTNIKHYSSEYGISNYRCAGAFAPAPPPSRTESLVVGYFSCRMTHLNANSIVKRSLRYNIRLQKRKK